MQRPKLRRYVTGLRLASSPTDQINRQARRQAGKQVRISGVPHPISTNIHVAHQNPRGRLLVVLRELPEKIAETVDRCSQQAQDCLEGWPIWRTGVTPVPVVVSPLARRRASRHHDDGLLTGKGRTSWSAQSFSSCCLTPPDPAPSRAWASARSPPHGCGVRGRPRLT